MTTAVSLHQRILDHLADAVLLFSADAKLRYINIAGEILFAASARQLLGLQAGDLLGGAAVEQDLKRSMQSGASITLHNVELGRPPHSATVNLSIVPFFDNDQADGVLVYLQQVDRQLRISMEEQLLAQQNAARMVLRGLAHEVKNPLGGLRGAAQLLERELTDPELKEYTGIIMEESDRLQSLVDRMLGPNTPSQRTPLNIHKVLERVRQLVQVEAPSGVVIQRDYDPSIPEVSGDSDQLIQAILNIVRNAAQAVGDHGNITLRTRVYRQLTIGTQRSRLAVKIDIIDDGPGIPAELLSQIFYPMVTGRADGTGLGLSIAQSLINRHGGLVECVSEPGRTVFSVYLPLEDGYE
ncbi:MAG: nitrogen regulation protein NR(II) [Methylococcaceae bacterium]|nr:MAG: nitrogen regulation protein NR(II) [Methylococcaceae bacterium]